MIGGTVYAVNKWLDDRVAVTVQGTRGEQGDFLDIELERTDKSLAVQIGDSIWWQGRYAFWTQKGGRAQDVRIPRLGYSTRVPVD